MQTAIERTCASSPRKFLSKYLNGVRFLVNLKSEAVMYTFQSTPEQLTIPFFLKQCFSIIFVFFALNLE